MTLNIKYEGLYKFYINERKEELLKISPENSFDMVLKYSILIYNDWYDTKFSNYNSESQVIKSIKENRSSIIKYMNNPEDFNLLMDIIDKYYRYNEEEIDEYTYEIDINEITDILEDFIEAVCKWNKIRYNKYVESFEKTKKCLDGQCSF
jgi:hypothetical protein